MRTATIRTGDVVELSGDPVSLWLVVTPPADRRLVVMLRGRGVTRRTVKARDVVAHWRRAGK